MRLPYVPDPVPTTTDAESKIVERIKDRRAPGPLLELDRALLHAPPVADGWNSFLGSIRERTTLTVDIRELAISRVALVNKAQFEWLHHAPLAKAAGVKEEGLRTGEGLTPKQRAVFDYTDAMTKEVTVSEAIFKQLQEHFTNREIVEITATIGAYNCCSRFLVALDVGERNSQVDVATWQY